MAARKRRRRKKRGGGFLMSLFTFCIVVGAIITSVTVFLKVNDIYVTGLTRYSESDIILTAGIKTGDNMFMINKFDVAERILSRYPYIEQIKIRRKLPDTFTFEITERVASAYIEADGLRWLIDSNAYILELLEPDAEVKLPKVTGGKVLTPYIGSELILENEDQLSVLKEVLEALRYTDMSSGIVRIEIDKLYDINLVYGDRFLVTLGDAESLSKKIEMLRAVIGELTDFDRGTINVSAVKEARFKPNSSIDLSEKAEEKKEPESISEESTEPLPETPENAEKQN